jgi:hypothetical protein
LREMKATFILSSGLKLPHTTHQLTYKLLTREWHNPTPYIYTQQESHQVSLFSVVESKEEHSLGCGATEKVTKSLFAAVTSADTRESQR